MKLDGLKPIPGSLDIALTWLKTQDSIDCQPERVRPDREAQDALAKVNRLTTTLADAAPMLRHAGVSDAHIAAIFQTTSVRVRQVLGDGFE